MRMAEIFLDFRVLLPLCIGVERTRALELTDQVHDYDELAGLVLVTCKSVRRTERSIQEQCVQILHIDCVHHYVPEGDETLCCSNNKTYANLCEYAKAKCQGHHIHIDYLGVCVAPSFDPAHTTPFTSTAGTTKHFHLSQRIEELFCSQRDTIPCDTTLNPVCATDGKFYQNSCEYTKAKCTNPTLQLQGLEMCKS